MRLTVGTPEKASQNVHIFGPCIVHGLCVTDDKTIASLLQKTIKENGYKNGYVMWPIRTAVSGKQMTPGGATELMEVLGKEESIARIKKGIELLEQ